MHSELHWSEFNWIHQRQKQVNPHHTAHIPQEGHEEVRLPLQPELLGVVWQLPAVAHQGGQGVCRPSLPHPPHQVIPSWRTPWSQSPSRSCSSSHSSPESAACLLYQGVRHPRCGLSLPSPLTWSFTDCLAGSTTCPWPVQLAAITIYLVARCQGALALLFK